MLEKLMGIIEQVDDIFMRKKTSEIQLEDRLIEDLGMDSLGRVSLFHEINFELDSNADEAAAMQWKTIADVVAYMQDKV